MRWRHGALRMRMSNDLHGLSVAVLVGLLLGCQSNIAEPCSGGATCALHPTLIVKGRVQASINLSVGSVGLLSLGTVALIARLPPHPGGFPVPWVGVLVYAALANLCYTLGAVGDLVLRRVLGHRAAAVGPVLFRYGFVFSLGLTLLPIPVAALGWLVSWL
jgi:hypothetical protein